MLLQCRHMSRKVKLGASKTGAQPSRLQQHNNPRWAACRGNTSIHKQNICIIITSGVHNMRWKPQSKAKSLRCYQLHDLPHNATCRFSSAKRHHKVSRVAAKSPQFSIFNRKTCKQWLHKSPPPVASVPWLKGAYPVL